MDNAVYVANNILEQICNDPDCLTEGRRNNDTYDINVCLLILGLLSDIQNHECPLLKNMLDDNYRYHNWQYETYDRMVPYFESYAVHRTPKEMLERYLIGSYVVDGKRY